MIFGDMILHHIQEKKIQTSNKMKKFQDNFVNALSATHTILKLQTKSALVLKDLSIFDLLAQVLIFRDKKDNIYSCLRRGA